MSYWEILLIAIGLGTDAFSVGISIGCRNPGFRQYFRATFHFGLFQFFMPLIGWYVSTHLVGVFARFNAVIAAGLLFLIALNMLREAFDADRPDDVKTDITRGWTLVGLSLATSIDAFGVGLSVGLLGQSLLVPCLIIGIVAALMTFIGIRLGAQLVDIIDGKAEIIGAIILLAIAVKIIITN